MTELPFRIYVVSGEPAAGYTPPNYSTYTRSCHFPDFTRPSDQVDEEAADQLRAVPNQDDTTSFIYACNL